MKTLEKIANWIPEFPTNKQLLILAGGLALLCAGTSAVKHFSNKDNREKTRLLMDLYQVKAERIYHEARYGGTDIFSRIEEYKLEQRLECEGKNYFDVINERANQGAKK